MSGPALYPHPLPGSTIRLLNVQPGEPGSPLICSLQETSLESPKLPLYQALSYVWGPIQPSIPITCSSQQITITLNLHAALLEYRSRAITLPIWVDALCINQSDVAERTSQVRMMQEIYSKASCVVIWLGPSHPTDAAAIKFLKIINQPWATITGPYGRKIPLFTNQDAPAHDAEIGAKVADSYFDALAMFLMRPWFSRIWIVQELMCARQTTIWCGDATLDDFPLLEAASRIAYLSNTNARTQIATTALPDPEMQYTGKLKLACAGRLEMLRIVREQGLGGITNLLLATRCFDATDPRDKIFALVGLADDVETGFVDYEKSYEEVITELSRMTLDGTIGGTAKNECVLNIWSCITRADEDEESTRPSWVVDWLALKDSLYTPFMSQYPSEPPVINKKPEIEFTKDESGQDILHIRATLLDTITHIIPSPLSARALVPQSTIISLSSIPETSAWYSQIVDLVAPNNTLTDDTIAYPFTGTTLYEAFWRTLCCNRSSLDPPEPPVDDTSYIAMGDLLVSQRYQYAHEQAYRRSAPGRKRISAILLTAATALLTYRLRAHKPCIFLPLTLPLALSWLGKAWDFGLNLVLLALHTAYQKASQHTQIAARDFEGSHSMWAQGRLFGTTRLGLMGWVPVSARVGDVIGSFKGCRLPFVFRAVGRDGEGVEGWRIVGDAYLHGVMEGESEAEGVLEGEMVRIV